MPLRLLRQRVITAAVASVSDMVSLSLTSHRATLTHPGSSRDPTPDMTFPEMRKGSASRKFGYSSATKSHRRGSAFSLIGGFPATVSEEDSTPSPSTSKSSSGGSGYKIDLEYASGKTKSSKKRHKSKR